MSIRVYQTGISHLYRGLQSDYNMQRRKSRVVSEGSLSFIQFSYSLGLLTVNIHLGVRTRKIAPKYVHDIMLKEKKQCSEKIEIEIYTYLEKSIRL